jgi:uncharacterized peroxidase-related enzyme
MSLIAPPDLDEIDAGLRAEYELGRGRFAHFDQLRRVLIRVPAAFRAADGMYGLIMERGLLDRAVKEAMFVTCAGVRQCRYGQAAHGTWLVEHVEMTNLEVESLARGEDLVRHTASCHVLLAFARKVAAAPYRTVDSDIEALREAGFDTPEIIEALTVVGLSGWMNGYADALGLDATDVSAKAAS